MDDESFSDVCSNLSDTSYLSDIDIDDCQSINFDLSNGSPINVNNFNIGHFNINSITAENRLNQLSDICQTLNFSVLVITESKLDETIPSNLITIPGYHQPVRRDRIINGRNGGGVLIYIAEYLVFQHKTELQSDSYEHIWVDIKIKDIIFSVNALYRPPSETTESHNKFLETCNVILQKLNSHRANYKIITSDLNFGNIYCKYPILSQKPLDAFAPDLFTSLGFTQLIDIPTRVTEDTVSLIDLFFVDKTDDIICHGTLPKIADHDGIVASFQLDIQKPTLKTKCIYDYKNADIDGLINHIKHFDFNSAVFSHDAARQADIYNQILINAFDQFVPCKTITIRPFDQPWSNRYTRLLLRRKNRNYQLYKKINVDNNLLLQKTNTPPEILTKYLNKRNRAFAKSRDAANASNTANRRVKTAFYNTINNTLNNNSISAKNKFKILLKLMSNNKFSGISPLNEKNYVIHDSEQKSKIFNDYFASKSNLQGKMDHPPILVKKEYPELQASTK